MANLFFAGRNRLGLSRRVGALARCAASPGTVPVTGAMAAATSTRSWEVDDCDELHRAAEELVGAAEAALHAGHAVQLALYVVGAAEAAQQAGHAVQLVPAGSAATGLPEEEEEALQLVNEGTQIDAEMQLIDADDGDIFGETQQIDAQTQLINADDDVGIHPDIAIWGNIVASARSQVEHELASGCANARCSRRRHSIVGEYYGFCCKKCGINEVKGLEPEHGIHCERIELAADPPMGSSKKPRLHER